MCRPAEFPTFAASKDAISFEGSLESLELDPEPEEDFSGSEEGTSASAAADFFFSSRPLSSFSTLGNALSAATRSTNVRRSERVSGATSTTVAVLCSSIHSSVSLAVRAAPVARNRSESRESFPPHKSSRSLRLPSWPPPKVSVALDMPPSLSAASAISPPRAWSVMPPIAAAASALRLALESLRGVARRRAFSLGGEATAASDDALVGPPPSSDARETLPPSPRRTLTDASGPAPRELFALSIPPSSAGRLACVIRRTSGTEQCSRTALRKATLAGSISCASSTRSMNPGRLGCAGAACTLLPSKSRCIISASATHRRFVPSCERRRFPSEYFPFWRCARKRRLWSRRCTPFLCRVNATADVS